MASTTYPQWEYDLLTALGAPPSTENLDALNYWEQSEGTAYANNPLAISTHYPGATHCIAQCGSASEIMAYDTMADGIAATASFLGASSYAAVVSAFKSNAGLSAIWQAINQSGWCKGCAGGKYPPVLYQALGGKAPAISTAGGSGSGAGAGSTASTPNDLGCQLSAFGACIISKGELKALKGGLLLAAGAILMGLGGFELVTVALKGTATGRQVAGSSTAKVARQVVKKTPARAVPGISRIGSSSSSSTSSGSKRQATRRVKSSGYSESDLNKAFAGGREKGHAEGRAERAERRRQEGFGPDDTGRPGARGASSEQFRRARQAVGKEKAAA